MFGLFPFLLGAAAWFRENKDAGAAPSLHRSYNDGGNKSWTRQFTAKKLAFSSIFWGIHWALFAYGW
ncbi:hypothetical protein PMIN01_03680 [Paraphaeosphaeria minitans]|uniref:Uncharacterized protein n=1 Tax=Paraphaeosphaeria minitans TaxID=565426 RepID=A0A9P6KTK0_9PLEO|nr:hypothetical protein PMIN01_03680 [Paraphaeosphaeria minitans]